MRAAVIENGKVANIIEVESLNVFPDMSLVDAGAAHIGDLWDGERFLKSAPPPEEVPASVTRRQARQQLLLDGLLGNVEPAINAIPDPTQRNLALIEWQDSQVFERNRPLVQSIGTALGLTNDQVDQLFIKASKL